MKFDFQFASHNEKNEWLTDLKESIQTAQRMKHQTPQHKRSRTSIGTLFTKLLGTKKRSKDITPNR